ncbi:MAG: adenylate/guanylate cyclase domain-containing protein [Pseudomonadota bacterium]
MVSQPERDEPVFSWMQGEPSRPITRIVDKAMRAGTSGYPRKDRRRLSFINLCGYLAAVSSVTYAINFAIYNHDALMWLIIGNLVSACLTATAFLWHRFNGVAAVHMLTVTLAVTLCYFISVLGRDSGVQLNFIGAVALAFIAYGLDHLRSIFFVTVTAIVLHTGCYFAFETGSAADHLDPAFIAQLYALSAGSIIIIIALVVLYTMQLAADAEERSEKLLVNIFPEQIADQLRYNPDRMIADRFDEATVLFADIVGFTPLSSKVTADELIGLLNDIFSRFDDLGYRFGTEKIKTIGDCYMCVSGVPVPTEDHTERVARVALGMLHAIKDVSQARNIDLDLRVGIARGSLTAGVIGKARFAYDVWAPTVNLASRLESNGEVGRIHVSESVYRALGDQFEFSSAPEKELKGIGKTKTWYLEGELGAQANPEI